MKFLGILLIIIAFVYILYGYLGQNMVLIYNRYINLSFNDEVSFFKIQFYGSITIFIFNFILGVILIKEFLPWYSITLCPLIIYGVNFLLMYYCRCKKYISF